QGLAHGRAAGGLLVPAGDTAVAPGGALGRRSREPAALLADGRGDAAARRAACPGPTCRPTTTRPATGRRAAAWRGRSAGVPALVLRCRRVARGASGDRETRRHAGSPHSPAGAGNA